MLNISLDYDIDYKAFNFWCPRLYTNTIILIYLQKSGYWNSKLMLGVNATCFLLVFKVEINFSLH